GAAGPGVGAPDAVIVERNSAALRELAAWRSGHFAFQGEASQLIAPLLDLYPGARVLDACAAPGGKAGHAGAHVGQSGLVVALDRRGAGRPARPAGAEGPGGPPRGARGGG